jgi:citrate synthase
MMRVFSIVATALGGGTLAQELRMGSTEHLSRQMLFAFAGACGLLGPQGVYAQAQGEQPLAVHVLQAMEVATTPALEQAINTALILGADHELSSSTFSARIAASTGATLHACVVAAQATHQGAALAGGADAAEDLIDTLQSKADLKGRLAEAELKGQRLLGFGLPIYPKGDPRAAMMIKLAQTAPGSAQTDLALRFVEGVTERVGLHPNIEMGLVLLCKAWRLPPRSACALWGIGRTAGWIAHALEQRLAGFTIRPRGLYQGKR